MTDPRPFPLLNLPVEIQRIILEFILSPIDIHVVRGDPITKDDETHRAISGRFAYTNADFDLVRDATPLYKLPLSDLLTIQMYQNVFAEGARVPHWESYVRFRFPSTLAMADILLGRFFPPRRRALVKRITVEGYPLPLYGDDEGFGYTTHFTHNVLPCLEGLLLNLFEFTDVYLPNDDGWGRDAYLGSLNMLLEAPGWQMLEVWSYDPEFSDSEVSELASSVKELGRETQDDDLCIELPENEVRRDEITGAIIGLDLKADEVKRQSDKDAFPADGTTEIVDHEHVLEMHKEKTMVRLVAKKGKAARVEPGAIQQKDPTPLTDLLKTKTWEQIRREGKYLYDEGMDDPCAHL